MNDHDPHKYNQPKQNKEIAEETDIPQFIPPVNYEANSKAKF